VPETGLTAVDEKDEEFELQPEQAEQITLRLSPKLSQVTCVLSKAARAFFRTGAKAKCMVAAVYLGIH